MHTTSTVIGRLAPEGLKLSITIPGHSERSSIVVQTREKWDVPNSQSFTMSHWEEHQCEEHRRRHPRVQVRTDAIPVYNCHGLTFAARRTAIWEVPAVLQILRDDHYQDVPREDTMPGDIILYISAENGDVEHSGIVVESPTPDFFVPKVWSKWGFAAEVVHWATDCPYDFSQARYLRIVS